MESKRESIPLSALQHYAFCPRQCALIHVEQLWSENVLTAEGRIMHDRAHEAGREARGSIRIARGLPLQSAQLGLHGVADVVEFHRTGTGEWQAFPVEYKRGRPKHDPSDSVQLCAQAICLEEMLATSIPAGAIFYGKTHRRHDVQFDCGLRETTARTAAAVHALLVSGSTPPPVYLPRCRACSLLDLCKPKAVAHSASEYLRKLIDPA